MVMAIAELLLSLANDLFLHAGGKTSGARTASCAFNRTVKTRLAPDRGGIAVNGRKRTEHVAPRSTPTASTSGSRQVESRSSFTQMRFGSQTAASK